MTRRQLEYEARQIRVAMEEQLGTCQDMEKRAQVNYLLLTINQHRLEKSY